jgi:hypothetical protein
VAFTAQLEHPVASDETTLRRLRELQNRSPTAHERGDVLAALRSGSDHLTKSAATTLAAWGDRESFDALRSFLIESYDRPNFGWFYRETAISALTACAREEDWGWILDHFFSLPERQLRAEFEPLVRLLPGRVLRGRVLCEAKSTESETRLAVVRLLSWLYVPEAIQILTGYANEESGLVADRAEAVLRNLGASPRHRTVKAMRRILGQAIPPHLIRDQSAKREAEIDLNDVFLVLHHLRMSPGWVLDYDYLYDGTAGHPLVFVRPAELPTTERKELREQPGLPDRICSDGTSDAYFQLAVLANMLQQFYLFWHAAFRSRTIVCHRSDVDALVHAGDFSEKLPEDFAQKARTLDLEPDVRVTDESAEVTLMMFSWWDGFYRLTLEFTTEQPHRLFRRHSQTMLKYNCGVIF